MTLKALPPSVRIKRPAKPTLLERLKNLWLRLKWWWQNGVLSAKLAEGEPVRSEAEAAVERIVMQTLIAADCVVATMLRGGPAIIIKHDKAQEGFIGKTYAHAADKAIEWLTEREGRYILTDKSTGLSRKAIKVMAAQRKRAQSARRKRH